MPRPKLAVAIKLIVCACAIVLSFRAGQESLRPPTAEELDDDIELLGYDVSHAIVFQRMSLAAESIEKNGPTPDSIDDLIRCFGLLGNAEGVRGVLKYGVESGVVDASVRSSAVAWIEHAQRLGARHPGEPPRR